MTSTSSAAGADRPAYLLCFIGSLVMSVFSGQSKQLHFPIGPDRILLGLGLLLLALDPVAWRARRLRLRTVHVSLALLITAIVISASLDGSLGTSYGFYALLDRVTVPAMFMTLAPIVFCTPERRDLLARCFVVLGLYLGLTAIFEVFGPHSLVLPSYILDPNLGIGVGVNQARGPFVAPEADGMVMSCCVFFAVFGFGRWAGRWRALCAIVVVLCSFGAFLTLTRSIWIGFVLAVLIIGLLDARFRRYLPRVLGAATLALVVALIASPSLRAHATARAGTSRSVYDRANTDNAALRILEQHPLTGIGWTLFPTESADYVRQASTYPVSTIDIEVHNVILSRASELGIPAALVFILALIAGPFRAAWRRAEGDLRDWRLLQIAFGTCWLVVSMLSPLPYPLPNSLLWVLTGIVLTPWLTRPRRQESLPPLTPRRSPIVWSPTLPASLSAPRRPTA